MLLLHDRFGEFHSSIYFKREKGNTWANIQQKCPFSFFVIGRLGSVCLTTKPASILIGQPSQVCPDTDDAPNSIGRTQLFFWGQLLWLDQIFLVCPVTKQIVFFLLKSAYQQPSRSTVKAKALLRQWTRKTAHFIQHKTTVPILRFHIFISFLIPFRFSDQNNLKHLFEFITFIFHYTKVTLNIKKKKLNWDLKCLCERML